jgi:hypothetical protein
MCVRYASFPLFCVLFGGQIWSIRTANNGIDMEVYEDLDFVNYDSHVPCDPTTLKK